MSFEALTAGDCQNITRLKNEGAHQNQVFLQQLKSSLMSTAGESVNNTNTLGKHCCLFDLRPNHANGNRRILLNSNKSQTYFDNEFGFYKGITI